jgi:2,5-furandicarboxylate decarboxylase 1
MSAAMHERLKTVGGYADVLNVMVLPSIFGVVIQLRQRFKGEAKNLSLAALSSQYLHPKIAIAVNEDVKILNPAEILWAISARVDLY